MFCSEAFASSILSRWQACGDESPAVSAEKVPLGCDLYSCRRLNDMLCLVTVVPALCKRM